MLIRLAFQRNNFLKKPVPSRGQLRPRICTIPYKKTAFYLYFYPVGLRPVGRILAFPAVFRCGPELPQQHSHRGQHNRPRLLTVAQIGGGEMKYITDGYGERCRFDAFCKTVLRNEARPYLRDLARQRNRETEFSALSQYEMDKLCMVDEYPSDSILFTVYGYTLHIRDELVAEAFVSLSEQEQSILVLYCVLELTDGEIGGHVGMSRSAVQRHRTKTLNELRRNLKS